MPPDAPYRPTPLALLVAGAFFMEFLDGSIIATALPRMAQSLGTGAVALNVGISSYLLAVAIFILPSGWAADRLGVRRVFTAAIVVFTLGSVLCGLAQSAGGFIAARILQGVGGAMMVPVGRLAVLRATPKPHLMGAIAVLTWPGLAAPILAPPLGGLLAQYASWRWIFFVNVPLGVAGLLLALRLVPPAPGVRRPFDLAGFAAGAVACAASMLVLERLGTPFASWPATAGLALAFAVSSAWLVRHLRSHPHPLVDPGPFEVPTFRLVAASGTAMRALINGVPFLLPLDFELGYGMGAFRAGLLTLALFAGNLGIKPFTSRVLRALGFRTTMLANGLFQAATMLACASLLPLGLLPLTVLVVFLSGASRSLHFTALNTLAFADVPERWMAPANTVFSVAFQLGTGIGVALAALALRVASGVAPRGHAPFDLAFAALALVTAVVSLDNLRLPRDAGDHVARRVGQGSAPGPRWGQAPPDPHN